LDASNEKRIELGDAQPLGLANRWSLPKLAGSQIKLKDANEGTQKTTQQLRSRAAELSKKLKTADAAHTAALAARQKHFVSGDIADDKVTGKLQSDVDGCASLLTGLRVAFDGLDSDIEALEAKIAAEEQAIACANAADKLATQVASIETVLPNWLEQCRELSSALSVIGHWHFDAGAMARFVENAKNEIEMAAAVTVTELKTMPAAIRDGRQPIPRDEGQAAPLPVPKPAPQTQTVFLLRSVKFRNYEGVTRYGLQFEDCSLPLEAAQRALGCGAAASLTDPRRRQLLGARGGMHVDPNTPDLLDLDKMDDSSEHVARVGLDQVLLDADFHVIDRGPTRTLSVTP
jgi:hypothetical protein